MIFPDVTVEAWAKRYNIKPECQPCVHCGNILHANIPFTVDEWRGFCSDPCPCGGSNIGIAREIGHEHEWVSLFDENGNDVWKPICDELLKGE